VLVPQSSWRPRWYYILRNKTSGKLYVGQTVQANMDFYCGSGQYWIVHCQKHGGHDRQNIEVVEQVWMTDQIRAQQWLDDFESTNPGYFLRSDDLWANRAKETTSDSAFAGITPDQRLEYATAGGIKTASTRPDHYVRMGKQQGRVNAESGHMQAIQKVGCVLGGKTVGLKNLQSFIGSPEDLEMRKDQGRKMSLRRHADKDPETGKSLFGMKIGKKSGETRRLISEFCKQMSIVRPGSNYKNVDRSAFAAWRARNDR
jgi:hypothetical protein